MIHLGVIGMSEGNGHPYSWSAICNGYDKMIMAECPFPVIPAYLAKEKYPDAFISDAKVTHIWTQDRRISEHIASASRIENIVDNMEDMIGQVDAVLLARDDAENHLEMCRPFLEAGLMVYIDKPLAFDMATAHKILAMEKFEGQVFSCSAMRYAREIDENEEKIKALGNIFYIDAITAKHWNTYSAHIIDPVLRIIGDDKIIASTATYANALVEGEILTMTDGLVVNLKAFKNAPLPLSLQLVGSNGAMCLEFCDTFYAFRGALKDFIASVQEKKSRINRKHMLTLVDWLERGL